MKTFCPGVLCENRATTISTMVLRYEEEFVSCSAFWFGTYHVRVTDTELSFGYNPSSSILLKRPNCHFKGKDRSKPLKSGMPIAHTKTVDVDNLSKFILDAMNEVVYKDDKTCVKLVASKLYDSEGMCNGRTEVVVTKFDERMGL